MTTAESFLSTCVTAKVFCKWFVTLIPLFASPTAVNTFNMDQEMGADLNIASGAIAISTALSFVTLFIWVSLFKHLGMF